MIRVCLVVMLSLLPVGRVHAQVVTIASPIAGPFRTNQPVEELARLTSAYNAGDWHDLQQRAKTIVAAVTSSTVAAEVKSALDLQRNYVALTWIGNDAFGKTLLMRFLAHDPVPDLFSADLPGLSNGTRGSALYELLLTRTADGRATSAYASTRETDPVLEALPAFIQALAGPIFGTIGALAGTEAAAAKPTLFATVKRVGLPYRRATVKLKSVARDPWFDEATFLKGVPDVATRLRFEDVPSSRCGRDRAEAVSALMLKVPERCGDKDLVRCIDELLAAAYIEGIAACEGGKPSNADVTALQLVDKRFREYVKGSLTNTAELELTFRNRPLTKFALGAGSGVMMSARLTKPRVKVVDGTLVADPLSRVMTMAFVNWSPGGYQPDAATVTAAERVRAQVGAVLTPDFGVMVGLNVLLARGIGVSGGFAVLFAKGARPEEIGSRPADSKDPYRLGIATGPYVGITYNYK